MGDYFMNLSYEIENSSGKSHVDKYKRTALYILISLTIIQQMPLIRELLYSNIRLVLYIGFGIFSIISFFNIFEYIRISFVRYFILAIVYSLILHAVVLVLYGRTTENLEIIIPFGILICSLNTNFDKKQLSKFLVWYIILSVILGISSILYYGQGFKITISYFLEGKNQIGTLLGISTVITGIWILNKKQFDFKYSNLILKASVYIILIVSILIIRNRSSLVGILVVTLLALFKEFRFKRNLVNLLIIQLVLIIVFSLFLLGVFDGVFDFVYKSIFYNFDITDLNSISAGRVDVYILALEFIKQHPILGELGGGSFIQSIPHNYILNKWVNYGILGSLPLILFYIFLWFFAFKELRKQEKNINFTLPLWVLLFSLIVSLFEYTYPYGPGVSQLMVWFLLGQYFRRTIS